MLVTIIGIMAAVCTTAAFVPQALKTIRTKNVEGMSLGMYLVFALGIVCWLIYGFAIKDIAIILANIVTVFFVFIILYYIIKYSKSTPKDE